MTRTPRWSSRSLGSRLQHEFFYACIWLGGWRLAYAVLATVVLFYTLRPAVRERSRPYLSRRFPGAGRLSMFLHAFRLNLAFGKVLVDRAARGITGQGKVDAPREEMARFTRLLDMGRGLLVLTAHVGAWQWAMSELSFTGRRMHVLYRRDTGDVDRQYFEHVGGDDGPRFIDPCSDFGGVIEVMAALRAGEVVCAMGDRVLGDAGNTVEATLLGGKVRLPLGPFLIAARLATPMALVFVPRTGACRARVLVPRVFEDTHGSDPMVMADEFARALEDFARDAPYQFYNFYDLWASPGILAASSPRDENI
ncbi:lipid A biosynthesis acyltransferase [Solidesulfovibrio carbinoliphilus subsp. oakridgensis]|uniref:Lipid A biosynthesis acyltransferase n=1 Tax=Solidesulfovibrio carbinoliphilus subsp. oakridgensis TaxID=694327 RepID=G7QBI2_9BACT|nr:lysophospholipid acyltransferase family protein [Solidesulfovibrio carbinoliphilus]EHJ48845.1 lipid A biosynthesis acyltransferase [Solidesulfovibrio carbinoliphilus subsp. oakridgensis]